MKQERYTPEQLRALRAKEPKRSKYGVAPKEARTDSEGNVFDSAGEMRRWQELQWLHKAAMISGLERQKVYTFVINGIKVGTYKADFIYVERGQPIVEDFKSSATRTEGYRLRKKLMLACFGLEIRESTRSSD